MEGGGFPAEGYREAEVEMDRILDFLAEEERRFQSSLLRRGGIDTGRLRRRDVDVMGEE